MSASGKNIFISFSPNDDIPGAAGERGWVSSFNRFLEILLTQVLGEKPSIQTSVKNNGSINNADVFISILSPEYLKSKNQDELSSFLKQKSAGNDLRVNGKPRVLKVLKSLIPTDIQPPDIREFVNYDLFRFDVITGDTVELKQFFGPDAERNYWMKLVDLSYDIANILGVNVNREENRIDITNDEGESVYLAETGRELSIHRDIIKRELIRHGYRVFPDKFLTPDQPDLESVIRKEMEKCKLSIHLIGESFAEASLDSETSVMELENKIAAERCEKLNLSHDKQNREFTRLIWISPEIRETNERQRLFLENLKRDTEAITGADILQTSLEDLKTIIRTELMNSSTKKELSQRVIDKTKTNVYLIVDPQDLQDSNSLVEYLTQQGFNVLLPEYHTNVLKTRMVHQDLLKVCDGALVYFGVVSEFWIKSKIQDILKAPGFGRTKPLNIKGIYAAGRNQLKDPYYTTNGVSIMYNNGNKFGEVLQPFLNKLLNK